MWPQEVMLPLSPECLGRMRALTLSKREFGFQLVPRVDPATGRCAVECLTHLIQGTEMSADDPDVALYGDDVEVASTPFYREVFSVTDVCGTPSKANIFGHTHQVGTPAPPSLGDFAAHAFMGNLRQQREDQGVVLNTHYVVAFEGIYEYNITEPKFRQLLEQVRRIEAEHPREVAAQRSLDPKELADVVVDKIKRHITAELDPYNSMFYNEVERLCRAPEFNTKGARMLDDKLWKCKGGECQPDYPFEFARRLESCPVTQQKLQKFLETNSYAQGLRQHGYYYRYFPYDMVNGVELPVKVSS